MTLENGGTIDLSDLANTDDQALTYDADTKVLSLEAGGDVDLSGLGTSDLLQGNILVGDAANKGTALDATGDGKLLIGDGTTVNSVTVSGDITIDNTGNAQLDIDVVGSAEIIDGSISAVDIEDNAISANKLNTGSVTELKIADGAVSDTKISSVGPNKINQGGATSNQVLKWDGSSWTASGDADNQTLDLDGNVLTIRDGNSVSIAGNTPAEDQVLTWKNGEWIAATVNSNAGVSRQVKYYSIDPTAFVGLGKDGYKAYYYADSGTEGGFVATDDNRGIAAPVNLPHGATITEVTFYYYDNSLNNNMDFRLVRKDRRDGSSNNIVSGQSSGTPGFADLPIAQVSNNVVDNSGYSYRVVVDLNKYGHDNSLNDIRHRVYSVVIKYTEDIPGGAIAENGSRMGGAINTGSEPENPQDGMLWLDPSYDGRIRIWDGSNWQTILVGEIL